MISTEIVFPGGAEDVVLSGTIFWPPHSRPVAAFVFIHSSGMHDQEQQILCQKSFFLFCLKLVNKGFAVLQFDTRGNGNSTGTAFTSTFDDAVADATAAVDALRKLQGINPRRIFVIGHSDGGLLAANVGLHTPLAGVVTLASPGCPIEFLLLEQTASAARAAGATKEHIAHQLSMDSAIYRIVLAPLEEDVARAKAAKVIEKHLRTWPNIIPLSHANLKSTAKKMAENLVEAPFRSFLRQNPPEILRRSPAPFLHFTAKEIPKSPRHLTSGPSRRR